VPYAKKKKKETCSLLLKEPFFSFLFLPHQRERTGSSRLLWCGGACGRGAHVVLTFCGEPFVDLVARIFSSMPSRSHLCTARSRFSFSVLKISFMLGA